MSTKSKHKIIYEPIIFIVLSFAAVLVFLLNKFIPSLRLETFTTSPSSLKGELPFKIKEINSWLRIFFYILGTKDISRWILFSGLLLLIPEQENNYGTFLTLIMIILSTIFSGVLFACFSVQSFSGCDPLIFLFVILRVLSAIRKKSIPLSDITGFIFYIIFFLFFNGSIKDNLIPLFICFAGGLCGSLVSFITVKKSGKRKTSGKKAETVIYFDNEKDSPRFKKNNSSEDETIIGTLEL
ncbi:MAG: hypothetical protein MJ182_01635 [Treponema sp.]|nr:hypothetical protein [Treponema sp.]